MRRIFVTMVAAAGVLFATSCVKDASTDAAAAGKETTVTFTLNGVNALGTRTISDGKSVDELQFDIMSNGVSIFNDANAKPETTGFAVASAAGEAYKLSVSLIKGQTYTYVFWAQNAACEAYTVDSDWSVTVDYSALTNNLESSDAFYASGSIVVTGNDSHHVDLRRPFAQVNVGITEVDYAAAKALGLEIETSSVKFTGVANKIDLFTGNVDGSQAIELKHGNVPADKLTVNDVEYRYLSMSYILAAAEKSTVGAEYTFSGSVDVALNEGLSSVPVQRNWRTNIVGRLLTGIIDFEIVVDGEFDGDHGFTELELAAALGGTVVLKEDTEIEKILNILHDVTIDLNGHKLLVPETGIRVHTGANLTITGDGEVSACGEGASTLVWAVGGTVTIESGTFKAEDEGELIRIGEDATTGGTVYIKGGTFISGAKSNILDCNDAAYAAGVVEFVVTGGVFYNFNPSDCNLNNGEHANLVSEGYTVLNRTEGDDVIYTVAPSSNVFTNIKLLKTAAANGEDVYLGKSLSPDLTAYTSIYNNYAIIVHNGGTIDGNGYTINMLKSQQAGKEVFGIYTSGGTIKNLKVAGKAFRGIYLAEQLNSDVYIDNCSVTGAYAINTAGSSYDYKLVVTNTIITGWSSWAALKSAEFTNCTFKSGTLLAEPKNNSFTRPYINTVFTNCSFPEGWTMSLNSVKDGCKIVFNQCTVNGTVLTAENAFELFDTIELASDAKLEDVAIFN